MSVPLQITFKNMDPSEAVEAAIRERAGRLERFFDGITHCHVVVEAPHRSGQPGKVFRVGITMSVPPRQTIVASTKANDYSHEDVYVALRDAFDAATRRLEEHARQLREPRSPAPA